MLTIANSSSTASNDFKFNFNAFMVNATNYVVDLIII